MGKKLQPKLRFRGFTDAWEQRRLGEIATVVGGGTPDTNNPLYWNGDINWFTPAEIGSNAYASKSERRITEEGLEHSSAKLLPAGRTILFTSRASIGLTAILTVDACTNQGFQSLVVSDRTDVFFLFGLCNQIKTQAIRNAAGSTFIEISGKQLAKMPLQIPSLDEQRRIGKIVRTIDSLIAAEKRKLDLLQKKKTALLLRVFGQKLRFKGYDNPWNRHKLGSITDSYSGGTPPVRDSSYYGGDIPFIRSAEIANESTELFITQSGLAASSAKWVKKGDVLYALYGANSGNTSFAKLDGVINQAVLSIRAKKGFSNSFIMYWLQRSKNAIIGTFLQGGQGNLSRSIVKKLSIQTPRIDEQERIGLFFIKIDSRITAETRKLDLLIDKKKALLQKMFV